MTLKIFNVAAFAAMIFMNWLANALPLGGRTTGELSAQYPNLFVPAGFTFSIWGMIYLLLLGFCILQFTTQNKSMVNAIGWLFAISCILNALWIVAWHYGFPGLSLVIMILILATLVMINHRISPFAGGITSAAFGIYLGWICIATIANTTALLVSVNWQGWGIPEEIWAVIMVIAGTVITILVLNRFRNPFTGITVIWALAGIIAARWPEHRQIIIASALSIITVAVFSLLITIQRDTA